MSDCDRRWQLDVYREGRLGAKDAQSFERHLKVCRDCRLRKDGDERLRRLAGSLPEDPPDELTLRRLRTRILRDVAMGVPARKPLPWTRIAAAALVLIALGGGGWSWHHLTASAAGRAKAAPAPSDVLAGVVTGIDARWKQVRRDGVETVTVDDGAVAIHVRPQRPGERFLVALPDGELEVRGTTFDVLVRGGATREVRVEEGRVEVRLHGRPTLTLAAGDAWAASTPAAAALPSATATASSASPSPRAAASTSMGSSTHPASPSASASASPVAPAPDDGTASYASAVDRLRSGRGDEAAAAFHAFLLAHPSAPQAEDASFLEAVALARAGRGDAAALAAEHHLAGFPSSFHRKEASILVARAASQRGDCARARSVLSPWLGSAPDGDVRSALGSCPP
jgi:hypothetical protein